MTPTVQTCNVEINQQFTVQLDSNTRITFGEQAQIN